MNDNNDNYDNLLGAPLASFSGRGPPKNGGGFLCWVRFLSQTRDAVVGITAESTPPNGERPVLF